jgi:very-short-patch-repair endonuclease
MDDNLPKDTPCFMIGNNRITQNFINELPCNIKLKERVREMRKARNLPEVLFWQQVNKGGFHKIDFYRQRIIGSYIVDFYVKKLGLVVEIDGSSHDNKVYYDKEREDYLISFGLRVYRITANDILKHLHLSMIALEDFIIDNYGTNSKT